ncbi:hypothetical protein JTE90_017547 [Oedothorax gibbosus]|uniref:Uncharacterized protein n=1 Tax=Oedothorax gibbosus TaxID=931172 RepID=A0AAV6TKT0_9ARAC|nr:hypothetical protein JTE90_017547 [Oedothorax gibbosus]
MPDALCNLHNLHNIRLAGVFRKVTPFLHSITWRIKTQTSVDDTRNAIAIPPRSPDPSNNVEIQARRRIQNRADELRSSSTGSVSSDPDDVIEVTDIIGGYGPWQRDIFVLLFLASIPSAWHNLQMTFMAPSRSRFQVHHAPAPECQWWRRGGTLACRLQT